MSTSSAGDEETYQDRYAQKKAVPIRQLSADRHVLAERHAREQRQIQAEERRPLNGSRVSRLQSVHSIQNPSA